MSVYNGAAFIREAISSILNQSFSQFEFIIIDDGSMDNSAEIVKEFSDDRIRFFQDRNRGLSTALNQGIRLAKCDWIARMDADDIALPHRLQHQWEYVCQHPDVVAVGGIVHLIDADNHKLGRSQIPPCDHEGILTNLLHPATRHGLAHSSVMMRKEAVVKCGGYRKEFLCSEDRDLWLRLSRVGKLSCLPEAVLLLRKHDQGVSFTQERSQVIDLTSAIVCHLAWKQTGIDLIQYNPEMWEKCVVRINYYVDQYGLMKAKNCRKELVLQFRRRSILGLFSATIHAMVYRQLIHAIRLPNVFREIIDKVVAETVAVMQKMSE
jgi:glycosyltransferase involved in cell wall biosynthesis